MKRKPMLTVVQILAWADDHQARTGVWPGLNSGSVAAAPREGWHAINQALWEGLRGLSGGDSLARLLARERGALGPASRPPLTVEQILAWADAHQRRTGQWPGVLSGAIPESAGENWRAVNLALDRGFRGLSGGDSLARVLARHGRRRTRRRSQTSGLPLTAGKERTNDSQERILG
jgi:hypothetical protein